MHAGTSDPEEGGLLPPSQETSPPAVAKGGPVADGIGHAQAVPFPDRPLSSVEKSRRYRKRHPERVLAYSRKYAKEHPEWKRLQDRKQKMKKYYGLTPEMKIKILERQGGRCAICGTTRPGGKFNEWQVDHDHKTKQVRGLLCIRCNIEVGMYERADLRAIATYLQRENSV